MKLKAVTPIRIGNGTKENPEPLTAQPGEVFVCGDADGAQFLAQGCACELSAADLLANPDAALELAERAETLAKIKAE